MATENKETETPPAPPDNKEAEQAAANIQDKIEDIADEIKETDKEDKDEQWRADLLSRMETLATDLADLKKAQGNSAELTALQQQMARIEASLEKLQLPPQSSASDAEAAPRSQETPTATSLETAPLPAPPPPPPVKEPARRVKSWL